MCDSIMTIIAAIIIALFLGNDGADCKRGCEQRSCSCNDSCGCRK